MSTTPTTAPTPGTVPYSVVDAAGRVLRAGSCPVSALPNRVVAAGETLLRAFADPRTQYFPQPAASPPVPAARPILPIALSKGSFLADGKDSVVVTGLPAGAGAWVNGIPQTPVNGALTYTATNAATFSLRVSAFPAQDFHATFRSTPPPAPSGAPAAP